MNCLYCQRPIGEVTDCDGGKHGWRHDHQSGPDAFAFCGHEYGTCAMPESTLIDGLLLTVAKCEYEYPESSSGACDGGQKCQRQPAVLDLTDEIIKCAFHQ